MSGQISYENEGQGVVVTWAGVVSGDQIKKANECICTDAGFERLRYQIWDFTGADRLEASVQDARDIAMQDRAAAQKGPRQFVALVGSKAFFAGADVVFHVYEEVWSGFESRTFSTMAEARAWVLSMTAEPGDVNSSRPFTSEGHRG